MKLWYSLLGSRLGLTKSYSRSTKPVWRYQWQRKLSLSRLCYRYILFRLSNLRMPIFTRKTSLASKKSRRKKALWIKQLSLCYSSFNRMAFTKKKSSKLNLGKSHIISTSIATICIRSTFALTSSFSSKNTTRAYGSESYLWVLKLTFHHPATSQLLLSRSFYQSCQWH